ncbi:ATP-binding cassette domain-containing protein (plasmid) [Coraliomargarita sp. W4R53]
MITGFLRVSAGLWICRGRVRLPPSRRTYLQRKERELGHTVAVSAAGANAVGGGQRQRVAIAQAILRDPAVLILDEASANLDTILERDLATMLAAARVVLIDNGRVVADGTHDILMADPRYRSLLALHDSNGQRAPLF